MLTVGKYAYSRLFTCFLLSLGLSTHAQSAKTMKEMVKKHRQCISQCLAIYPTDRIKCSEVFYFQMDSMLTETYKSARKSLPKKKRKQLDKDQDKWMHERDLYFAQQDLLFGEKHKHNQWRSDMETITYEDKANFVKDRVMVLIAYAAGNQ